MADYIAHEKKPLSIRDWVYWFYIQYQVNTISYILYPTEQVIFFLLHAGLLLVFLYYSSSFFVSLLLSYYNQEQQDGDGGVISEVLGG